jgi:hypothetical protein
VLQRPGEIVGRSCVTPFIYELYLCCYIVHVQRPCFRPGGSRQVQKTSRPALSKACWFKQIFGGTAGPYRAVGPLRIFAFKPASLFAAADEIVA